MSVILVRDTVSYAEPLDLAIKEVMEAVLAAGRPIRGAESRVRAALDEKSGLEGFISRTTDLLKSYGFRDLPQLFQGSDAVPNCHHLTVGPWRGIFLVDPSNECVIGLVFSKEPHELMQRLDEIVGRNLAYPVNTYTHKS